MMRLVVLVLTVVNTSGYYSIDIQPSRCYNCGTNGTAPCEQSSSWAAVTCPAERPLCATATAAPDFRSSLICAPVTKKPCFVRTSDNSSFEITCVCNTHLCNAPFSSEWRNELLNFTSSNTNVKDLNVIELISKYVNDTEDDHIYKSIIAEGVEPVTAITRSSPQIITLKSVTATMNMNAILRDSERPRAEALKQQPTVPSDDDEDESEGSGSYEETRIHNHAVSAPAAPSSFLPADENSASSLYKNLFVTTLFIYLVL